jgi:hypothetical protein
MLAIPAITGLLAIPALLQAPSMCSSWLENGGWRGAEIGAAMLEMLWVRGPCAADSHAR